MMNFPDLERAHLTLAFLREFPDAVNVRIIYRRAAEQIGAVVTTPVETKRYTFQISSDDDGYLFSNDNNSAAYLLLPALPLALMGADA